MRALFGHGTVKPDPKEGEPHYSQIPHPAAEIRRLRTGRLSSDDALVTLAMAILGSDYSTLEITLHDFRLAREWGLLSSAHIWGDAARLVPDGYAHLKKEGLLGPDHNIVHGNYLTDDELALIIDSGVSVTATPPVEMQKHPAESLCGRVLALGGKPSIGADIEIYTAGDMFHVMRFSLQSQRIFDNVRFDVDGTEGEKTILLAREALAWATINNARALGLEARIGSITPGKQADIVLLRTDSLNMMPVNDPVQAVVFHAGRENVDTVFVAGKKMKENGKLIRSGEVLSRLRERLAASAERLLNKKSS
jgi:cytosine/adenosine deaminase-related metal-dependent hydrolase